MVTTVFTSVILLFFITPVAFQPTSYPYSDSRHWQAVFQSVFHGESSRVNLSAESRGHRETELNRDTPSTVATEQQSPQSVGSSANPHHNPDQQEDSALTVFGMVYLGAAYFLSMILATYFNVAFYHQILSALRGNEVSIRTGLAYALTRWQAVLLWATFAGLVGLLIRKLEERVGFFGKLVVSLIGTAWSVACIFVVPVLVMETESVDPFGMLKKSALTIKQAWGEALIGFVGVQVGSWLVALGSVVFVGLALAVSVVTQSIWFAVVSGLIWFLGIVTLSYITSVANHVYRCALYLYSTERTIVEPYSLELLQMAWKVKKVKS